MRLDTVNTRALSLSADSSTTSMKAAVLQGAQGPQGLPGVGSAAWTAATAVTTGTTRQAPDGSWIKSTASRTTRATFDATEQTFWTVLEVTPGTLAASAFSATLAEKLDNAATSADGALTLSKLTKVDASGAARAMTIPDGTIKGQQIAVEKTDASANTVTVTGKIRSTGSSSLIVTYQYETLTLIWGGTFWEPLTGHRTKASIDTQIDTRAPTAIAADIDLAARQAVNILLARMTVRPNRARQTAIKTLIKALITAGVWDKFDALYVMAAHDAQAARLNWSLGCAADLTAVNSPIFQIDRGFTGDGTTSYMDTGLAANVAEKFLAEDATIGVYSRTALGGANIIDISGGSPTYLNPLVSGNFTFRANTTSGSALTPSNAGNTSLGLFAWSRLSTTATAYKNGAQSGSPSTGLAAGTRASNNFLLMRDGGGANYSTRQLSTAFIASSLSATEHAAFYTALQAYMTTVGANV